MSRERKGTSGGELGKLRGRCHQVERDSLRADCEIRQVRSSLSLLVEGCVEPNQMSRPNGLMS